MQVSENHGSDFLEGVGGPYNRESTFWGFLLVPPMF